MKYMQTGGFQHHPLMRLTLAWTLLFAAGLWVTNALMHAGSMGLTPRSVAEHYLGSGDEFSSPRTARSMLEVTHAHMAAMGVMVLLLTHLAIFAPWSDRAKTAAIGLGFGSAFLGEASGWLVRFVSPAFAVLKLACFLVFQAVLAVLIAGLASFLLEAAREASRHRRRKD